jgi:hypothetical protein
MTYKIEDQLPGVKNFGLNTGKAIDFSHAPSCSLPSNTTVGGSPLGGAAQSPLQGRSTNIANNTNTPIFSFPLANGESTYFQISGNLIAKLGTDWAAMGFLETFVIYNEAGTLRTSESSLDTEKIKKAGSSINFDAAQIAAGNGSLLDLTINTGVVTISINPGDIGGTPDSMTMDHVINNPKGKTITFL